MLWKPLKVGVKSISGHDAPDSWKADEIRLSFLGGLTTKIVYTVHFAHMRF